MLIEIELEKHLVLTLLKVLRMYSLELSKNNSNRYLLISKKAALKY